jgi:hypothetical protein
MRWTIAICALVGLAALQDATPQIHKQGRLQILADYAGDHDEGRIGFDGDSYDADGKATIIRLDGDAVYESPFPENGFFKGSDFWFESGRRKFLRPQHGAKFSKGKLTSRGYKACADAAYSANALRLDGLAPSTRVCMRTSDKRYSMIVIQPYDPSTFHVTLDYITWEK